MVRDKPLHNFFFEYDVDRLFDDLSTWCTPWIDTCVLLQLIRVRQPETMLEIGTHRGLTTRTIAEKFPSLQITTVDPGDQIATEQRPRNQVGEYLAQDEIGALAEHFPNVSIVKKTFAQFCESDIQESTKFDFIFIDGNHTFNSVLEDSRHALEIISAQGIIVWHDYNNVKDVNRALAELVIPNNSDIVALHNTWIAYVDFLR